MEQPWQQPPEAAPDADDLPLAGLLAELLAASEAGCSPAADGEARTDLLQPRDWPESGPDAVLDASQVLRTLDHAPVSGSSGDSSDLSGMLLARLMADDGGAGAPAGAAAVSDQDPAVEPEAASLWLPEEERPAPEEIEEQAVCPGEAAAVECAPGPVDSPAVLMARLTGEEPPGGVETAVAPAPVESAQAAPEEMSLAETGFESEEPAILVSGGAVFVETAAERGGHAGKAPASTVEGACAPDGESSPLSFSALEEEELFEAVGICGPAGPPPGTETVCETEELEPCAGGIHPQIQPEPSSGAAAESARSEESGGEAGAAAGMSWAGQDQESARCQDCLSEAAPAEASEAPAPAGFSAETVQAEAVRTPQGGLSGAPGDDDEFELVDASQAELMLERLLDAARSAIRGTPAQGPEHAEPERELKSAPAQSSPLPGGALAEAGPNAQSAAFAEAPPAAGADGAGQQDSSAPSPAQQGASGVSEPAAHLAREDRPADLSPIPPAVMLMALGLPERLRARLESLGDAERILLKSQSEFHGASEQRPRLLVFRAGGESYALSMESVREVERVGRVTPVPGAPAFFRGLVNLRGEILPLLDLAALIGRKGDHPSSQRLIVAQAGAAEPVVALLVDELNGLAPLEESGAAQAPQPGPFRGSLDHRGRSVWWLNPAAVFGAEALEKAAAETAAVSTWERT